MNEPAPYFHWGFILISLPNLVLIGVMVLIFIVALIAPFPGHSRNEEPTDDQ
jgi:mannose/fructose/N-acetylgalactosamine-specific phosphotransferase system component IIC